MRALGKPRRSLVPEVSLGTNQQAASGATWKWGARVFLRPYLSVHRPAPRCVGGVGGSSSRCSCISRQDDSCEPSAPFRRVTQLVTSGPPSPQAAGGQCPWAGHQHHPPHRPPGALCRLQTLANLPLHWLKPNLPDALRDMGALRGVDWSFHQQVATRTELPRPAHSPSGRPLSPAATSLRCLSHASPSLLTAVSPVREL